MLTGRVARLSLRGAISAGGVAGLVAGMFLGGLLGALISWFAGAVVDWQRQLGFSLGVTQQLLPFGDQASSLETVADLWYVAVPASALLLGLLGALVGALAGGLWAALVNRGFVRLEVGVTPTSSAAVHELPERPAAPRRKAAGR